jgi:hypothetical protein
MSTRTPTTQDRFVAGLIRDMRGVAAVVATVTIPDRAV